MRRLALECGGDVYLNETPVLEVACRVADKKFALGLMTTGSCLAAPFRAFNAYCAKDVQIRENLRVDYSFLVSFNLHPIGLSPRIISNFWLEINHVRSDFGFSFG